MLTKINEIGVIVIGAAFAILGVLGISFLIDLDTALQFWAILVTILGSLGIGAGSAMKSVNSQATKNKVVQTSKHTLKAD